MKKYSSRPSDIRAFEWQYQKMYLDQGIVFKDESAGTDKYYVITIHQQRCYITLGDYIVQEPDGKHYYPVKAEIFEKKYYVNERQNALADLEDMQIKIGYVPGPVNIIALLGLLGEAGEVLNETFLVDNTDDLIKAEDIKILATQAAIKVDKLKKSIRDHKRPVISIIENKPAFDSELADQFYYLFAIARNRGLSLNKLAEMCLEKIKTKNLQKDISHGTGSK